MINRRQFIRAPLSENLLYADEGYVHKGKLRDLSESGLFIQEIPYLPKNPKLDLMFCVPEIISFQEMKESVLLELETIQQGRVVVRARGEIKRRVGEIEAVMFSGIGLTYQLLNSNHQNLIKRFIHTYTQNSLFILRLFQSGRKSQIDLIRQLSFLMNYPKDLPLPELRQTVRRDYHFFFQN